MITLCVTTADAGERLDRYLTTRVPDTSRVQITQWIAEGHVLVNGAASKGKYLVRVTDHIIVRPPKTLAPSGLVPETLPLEILYDDADMVVLNKAPGMLVHPGAGQQTGTMVHALLARYPGMMGVGGVERPGIVHRLDQGTSGVIVVAKHDQALRTLVTQFSERTTEKMYVALCWGQPAANGQSNAPIGRHPTDRKKMSTQAPRGRPSQTYWTVREYWPNASWLEVRIATGRTHQIRVHLSAAGHPLIGDGTYGGKRVPKGAVDELSAAVRAIGRPALHAWRLALTHPRTGERMQWEAPIPADLLTLAEAFRKNALAS